MQILWLCGRIGLLPAHSNTNGIPMEKKGHKWPNPVPAYQVKRLEICWYITHVLPWLTCILVVMHLSSLPNLKSFQYLSPGLGLFNSDSDQDLGFPDCFSLFHRLCQSEFNQMNVLRNHLGGSVREDEIDPSGDAEQQSAAC